jgi:hypothetical protein
MAVRVEVQPKERKPEVQARRKLGGLLVRRECWTLSWRARIAGLIIAAGLAIFLFFTAHPFLACTDRANGDVLVVEGWIHDWAMKVGVDEFKQHRYGLIYVTGGPAYGPGHYTSIYDTLAHVGVSRLKAAGLPDQCLQMVPSDEIGRDRTYNDAVTLRRWFDEHHTPVSSMNILTEGAHARRTRLLYEKAFNGKVHIGIISVSNPNYDAKRWWRYSDGVREVVGETVAYLYARFLFHPSQT